MKPLLIEIGVSELPIDAVEVLSCAFLNQIIKSLTEANIPFEGGKRYATARRLAVYFDGLDERQQDIKIEKKGPALKSAKDNEGNWTKAAIGFASSFNVSPDKLTIKDTPKGEWLYYCGIEKGQMIEQLLPSLLYEVINQLPIAKRMRWADREDSFIRPVTTLTILYDTKVIDAKLFNIFASNHIFGHRFHGEKELTLPSASSYEQTLKKSFVIADIEERKQLIIKQAQTLIKTLDEEALVVINEKTLNEINALVEFPVAVIGKFDPRYLSIPQEVLIKTMQDNQKYFAVTDKSGKLLPYFITISNIQSKQPEIVIKGNQKVIEPRFADAEFFWNNDKKTSLASRQKQLKKTVYQKQLGTIFDRSQRITAIAEYIAKQQNIDSIHIIRAAQLAKCDLVTEMVFEFGELQGIIGEYYALNDNENKAVATAIREQYLPKFSGDELPQTTTGLILSLADKIENLVGGFSVGAKPTGTKDPYALRRASLGVIRLLNETTLDLSISKLLIFASSIFEGSLNASSHLNNINAYINERLKGYYAEKGIRHDIFNAIISSKPETLKDFSAKTHALSEFINHSDATNLFAANKRIGNFLKKEKVTKVFNAQLLKEPAEKQLSDAFFSIRDKASELIKNASYLEALQVLSVLRTPLDLFFDEIMVLVEDEGLKNNRLTLLNEVFSLFIQVGDLSQIEV